MLPGARADALEWRRLGARLLLVLLIINIAGTGLAAYLLHARQYVVFVGGGNAILKPQASDRIVAYASPASTG